MLAGSASCWYHFSTVACAVSGLTVPANSVVSGSISDWRRSRTSEMLIPGPSRACERGLLLSLHAGVLGGSL